MKTSLFVIIVLISGALAGLVHGSTNFVIVEPYLDSAINIENQNLFASGEETDTPEFWVAYEQYRTWQKGGQILASVILGVSMGALFGIIYAISRRALPAKNDVKKSLLLGGLVWFSLFIIPFLKYPANPPTVGDADTVVLRTILFVSFIAISGLSVVGFYKLSKKFTGKRKLFALVGYAVFITGVFFAMPENPDEISISINLLNEFRMASVLAVSTFWIAMALIFGMLWSKFKPHESYID